MCLLCFMLAGQAQTVNESKWYDNYFVSATGGASYSFLGKRTFKDNINPLANVTVGRYLTPVTGIEVNYEMGFDERNYTFVDHHNLSADALLNLTNLFCGYKGTPRAFELVGVAGGGWFHTFGEVSNNVSVRGGLQFNINLGKPKAVAITFQPMWTYLPDHSVSHSYVSAVMGLIYRFKNSNGTHSFTIAKLYDQNEVNLLNEKVNSLREQNALLDQTNKGQAKQIEGLSNSVEELSKCCAQSKNLSNVVGFGIGSAKVAKSEMANLKNVADFLNNNKDVKLTIVGYADQATGSAERNQQLSEQRAANVANALEKLGVDPSQMTTKGVGSTAQPYEDNDMNRVVLFAK